GAQPNRHGSTANFLHIGAMRSPRALAFALLGALALLGDRRADSARAGTPRPPPCRPFTYREASYVVCTIDLTRFRLKTFLRGADGELYGGFERLPRPPPRHT